MESLHYFKFFDKSEITIHEDITATIIGGTTQIAYSLWNKVTNDENLNKNNYLAVFVHLVNTLNSRYNFIEKEINFIEIRSNELYNNLLKCC